MEIYTVFKETNMLTMKEISELNRLLKDNFSFNYPPMILFYEIKDDRSTTPFTILIETTDKIDFDPNVKACLLYWSGKEWCNTNEETKKRFAKDQPYFKYKWFNI